MGDIEILVANTTVSQIQTIHVTDDTDFGARMRRSIGEQTSATGASDAEIAPIYIEVKE